MLWWQKLMRSPEAEGGGEGDPTPSVDDTNQEPGADTGFSKEELERLGIKTKDDLKALETVLHNYPHLVKHYEKTKDPKPEPKADPKPKPAGDEADDVRIIRRAMKEAKDAGLDDAAFLAAFRRNLLEETAELTEAKMTEREVAEAKGNAIRSAFLDQNPDIAAHPELVEQMDEDIQAGMKLAQAASRARRLLPKLKDPVPSGGGGRGTKRYDGVRGGGPDNDEPKDPKLEKRIKALDELKKLGPGIGTTKLKKVWDD